MEDYTKHEMFQRGAGYLDDCRTFIKVAEAIVNHESMKKTSLYKLTYIVILTRMMLMDKYSFLTESMINEFLNDQLLQAIPKEKRDAYARE